MRTSGYYTPSVHVIELPLTSVLVLPSYIAGMAPTGGEGDGQPDACDHEMG